MNFLGKPIKLYSTSGPELTIIDANGIADSNHVVQCVNGEDANTILDGFTITGGNANGASYPDNIGGGMFNYSSSPTVTNCTFTGNSADLSGGGMFNENGIFNDGCNPTVTNCTFTGNSADYGGGMYNWDSNPVLTNCTFTVNSADLDGGGMYNSYFSSPTVTNCTFTENSAVSNGGGMYNLTSSSPTVTNCTFTENLSGSDGGGMFNSSSSPTVTNCTFTENLSGSDGGGMFNSSSSPTVTNCTFTGNSALIGGGLYNGLSSPTLTNCILWGNSPHEIADISSISTVSFCDVEGGYTGTGNIDADPCFVDAASGNLRILGLSPCIDVGDNSSVPADIPDLDNDANTTELIPWDLDGHPRFLDGDCNDTVIVDMGVYEFAWVHIGDFAGGCDVDFKDFAIFALAWMTEVGDPNFNIVCDISDPNDDAIDPNDLDIFTTYWLFGK
ncbi:MAG: right-handed parallel beta-helix repeat-containing protein [Planctomycetota bacterium]